MLAVCLLDHDREGGREPVWRRGRRWMVVVRILRFGARSSRPPVRRRWRPGLLWRWWCPLAVAARVCLTWVPANPPRVPAGCGAATSGAVCHVAVRPAGRDLPRCGRLASGEPAFRGHRSGAHRVHARPGLASSSGDTRGGIRLRKIAVPALLALAVAVSACTRPPAGSAVPGVEEPPASTPGVVTSASTGLDCAAIVEMSPREAAAAIARAGLTVSWRLQHTLPDGTMAADVVTGTPDGSVVFDVVLDGTKAFVFVAPPGDSAGARPKHPSC